MLDASFHCGSPGGKWLPMSPSPSAPSTASPIAWLKTSASLWPSSPHGDSIRTPPSTSGRPCFTRWMS